MKKLGLDGPFGPDEIQQYRDLADAERAKAHRTGKMIAYPGIGAALAGLATGVYGAAAKKPTVTTLGKILGFGGLGAAGLGGAHALQGSISHSDRSLLANLAESGRGSSGDVDRYAQRAHRYEPEFGEMMGRELKDVHPQLHSELRDARTRAMLEHLQQQMEQQQWEARADRATSGKTAGVSDWFARRVSRFAEPIAKMTGEQVAEVVKQVPKAMLSGARESAADVGDLLVRKSPYISAALGLGGTAVGGLTGGTLGAAQEAREGNEADPEYAKNVVRKAMKRGLISGAAGGALGTGLGAAVPYFGGRLLQIMGRA